MIWLLGLAKNRYVQYGAIVLAALLALRWYTNSVGEREYRNGKLEGIKETIKEHEKEWQRQEDALKMTRIDLDTQRQSIDAAKANLDASRAKLKTSLDSGLTQIKSELGKLPEKIAAIPAGEIPDEIRRRLDDLR